MLPAFTCLLRARLRSPSTPNTSRSQFCFCGDAVWWQLTSLTAPELEVVGSDGGEEEVSNLQHFCARDGGVWFSVFGFL